jgi:2-octaprenylphenol hydroxylase
MRVWDAGGSGAIHFDSADIGERDLGHIIENRVIQAALWERMAECHTIERFCPALPAGLVLGAEFATMAVEGHGDLCARLVVAADGARSAVRQMAGIATQGWRYDQTAVVATVTTERHHRFTAWQRFLPTGPVAFLPLHDGRSSIVWSTTPEQAAELMEMDEAAFLAALQRAFGDTLGHMQAAEGRGAFPLRLQHAVDYVKPRLALVGDAAHTIHPLAGQGVNLGLLDAAALAEVLLDAVCARKEVGSYGVLRRYERWRKGENLLMMAAMDGFKRLFGSRLAPLRWARNLGLTVADRSGPVKAMAIRRAMGLAGDLPKLALVKGIS